MQVTIRNWDTYNKRKDLKRPWWFALNNRLLEDPDFYEFSGEEIRAWIYILSQASQKRTGSIQLSLIHAEKACNVKISALKSTISKLVEKGILLNPIGIRTGAERVPLGTEQDTTEQDITKQNTLAQTDVRATELYSIYPKKVGKKKGLLKLKVILTKEGAFEKIQLAIKNYTEHCQRLNTEPKFIKHFDTFLGSWEDWLDPTAGGAQDFSKKSTRIEESEWPA